MRDPPVLTVSRGAINRLRRSEQAPLNQILGYSDLVAIVLERLGTFQGNFTGALGIGFVNRLAAQELLGFPCAPGDWRYAAHHHTRIVHGAAAALDDGRDGNDGVVAGEPLPYFVVETLATALGAGTWR
jgi:hypothetical protein